MNLMTNNRYNQNTRSIQRSLEASSTDVLFKKNETEAERRLLLDIISWILIRTERY